MLGHAVARDEEVADGGGEVEQRVRAQRLHQVRERAQLEQVLGHGRERQEQEEIVLLRVPVLAQHGAHLVLVFAADDDAAVIVVCPCSCIRSATACWGLFRFLLIHKIQKAIRRVAVVPRVRQQTELPVQEDHRIPLLQEIFGRRRAPRARGEIVDEAHRLVLERNGRASGGDEDDAPVRLDVVGDEGAGEGFVVLERFGRRVAAEVVRFGFGEGGLLLLLLLLLLLGGGGGRRRDCGGRH